jgi:hypothetical protein
MNGPMPLRRLDAHAASSSGGRPTRPVTALLAVACLLLPCLAQAQAVKEVNQQYQFWGSLNSTSRLTDRLGAIADFHVRRNDFLADPSFYFLRFGAHGWITEKLTVSLGYAHMWKAPGREGWQTWSNENRIYEQVQYAARLGRAQVVQRLRNEQRWQQRVEDDALTGESSFSDRVRYLLSFTLPLSAKASVPSLVLSDEVLLQFGRDVVMNTFDQNRLFTGVKQRLSRSWSFDVGYMMVYQQKSSGYQYDLNHTLRLFFYFTPDLRKVKSEHLSAGDEE